MSILTLPLPQPVIETKAFHEAAAHLAGAVAVVAWGAAEPRGLLVHTISVLSVEPARVLFAVDKGEPEHDALLLQQACGISLLTGDDEAEAERFSRADRASERFQADRWAVSAHAPPQLNGSLVHFSGFIDQKIDAGSHSLFVVRVGAAAVRNRAPLVYFDRKFRQLQPARAASSAQVLAMIEA